jgi:hypothetical protein
MPQASEYKIVMGNGQTVQKQLDDWARVGWKATSVSSCVGAAPTSQVQIVVLMEKSTGS